jgi:hypothetical protein
MPRTSLILPCLLSVLATAAIAQHNGGYAGLEQREIKALSPEQTQDLLEGRGMGLSLPAELNSSPGPLHVLQLRGQLAVTPEQAAQIERIRDDMATTAKRLGASIVQAETELDASFKSGTADETTIQTLTARIGTLSGELRAAHLTAHLKTRRQLSDTQVAAYNAARGYGKASPAGDHTGHQH